LEVLEKDLEKALDKGNAAASRRVRGGLRDVRAKARDLMKSLVALDKARRPLVEKDAE
jgi:hypothetical protein